MISPTTELAIITGALKLLSPGPERWTQGAYARDASGKAVGPGSKNAVCFCLIGAARRAVPGQPKTVTNILHNLPIFQIPAWNDAPERKYSDVITLLQTRADQLRGEIKREGGAG